MDIHALNSLLKKSSPSFEECEKIFSLFMRWRNSIAEKNQYKVLLRLLSKTPRGILYEKIVEVLDIPSCKYLEFKNKFYALHNRKIKFSKKKFSEHWFPLHDLSHKIHAYISTLNFSQLAIFLRNNMNEKNMRILLYLYLLRGDYYNLRIAVEHLLSKNFSVFYDLLFLIEKLARVPTVSSAIKSFYLDCPMNEAFEIFSNDFKGQYGFKQFFYAMGLHRSRERDIFSDVKYLKLDFRKNLLDHFPSDYAKIDLIFLYKENYEIILYVLKKDRKISVPFSFINDYAEIIAENNRLLRIKNSSRRILEEKLEKIFAKKIFNVCINDDVILIIANDIYFFPFENLRDFNEKQVVRTSSVDCLLMNLQPFCISKNSLNILYGESNDLKSTVRSFANYFRRKNIKSENPNVLIYVGHGSPTENSYPVEIIFGCRSHLPHKMHNFCAYFKRPLRTVSLQVGLLGDVLDKDINRFAFSFLTDMLAGVDLVNARKRALKKCEYKYLTGGLVVIHANASYFQSYFH